MSDRCCVEVTCRRRDTRRFERLGFKVVDDGNLERRVLANLGCEASGDKKKAEVVTMCDEQANFGHYGKLPKNIPYFGWHDSGGEYGPHEFACDGRKIAEVETAVDGTVVVRVCGDSSVDRRDLRLVKEYRACLKRARQALGETGSPGRKHRTCR